MLAYAVKVALTAVVIVTVAEIAKRSTLWAGVLASLPLTSILAFVWLHLDGEPAERIASLSVSIGWLVVPSLLLLAVLPVLLRAGLGFWPSLGLACLTTVAGYAAALWWLQRFGASA